MDTESNHSPIEASEETPTSSKGFFSRLSPKKQAFLKGHAAVSNSATILALVIYALLLLSRLIDSAFLSRESEYLSAAALADEQ